MYIHAVRKTILLAMPESSVAYVEMEVTGGGGPPPTPSNTTRTLLSGMILLIVSAMFGFYIGGHYTNRLNGITVATAHLALSMNTSANPCTDMWSFMCGSYADTHESTYAIGEFQTHLNDKLITLLKSAKWRDTQAGAFYAQCTAAARPSFIEQTVLSSWQQGRTEVNVSFGWARNPKVNTETLPYIYVDDQPGTALIPLYVLQDTATGPAAECAKDVIALAQQVLTDALVTKFSTLMVFGTVSNLCTVVRKASSSINENVTTLLGSTSEHCLSYVEHLWPGVISTIAKDLASPALAVHDTFLRVKQTLLQKLGDAGMTELASKVGTIACVTSHYLALEVYSAVTPNATFVARIGQLYNEKFMRDVRDTSVRQSWQMHAAEVNAYYDPYINNLFVTPGMVMYLEEGAGNNPLIYGRLGYIIAHERK